MWHHGLKGLLNDRSDKKLFRFPPAGGTGLRDSGAGAGGRPGVGGVADRGHEFRPSARRAGDRGIPEEDITSLQQLAEDEARQATSLYEFTRLINDHYDYAQKCALIENMWRVAFSDERLDKYEEHLIRRIAELIYVSHSDFIRTKLKVRDSD